jgi:hypothetical protein
VRGAAQNRGKIVLPKVNKAEILCVSNGPHSLEMGPALIYRDKLQISLKYENIIGAEANRLIRCKRENGKLQVHLRATVSQRSVI